MSEQPAKRKKPCQDKTDHDKSKKKPSFSREIVRCGFEGCSFKGVRYSLPRHTKAIHPGQKPRPLESVAAVLQGLQPRDPEGVTGRAQQEAHKKTGTAPQPVAVSTELQEEMVDDLEPMQQELHLPAKSPPLAEDAVKGKWNILRDKYRRIKNMARRSQFSDAEGHEARSRSRASTWHLYPLLDELLHAHTTYRSRTISSSVQKVSIKSAAANSFDENSEGADGSEFDDASLANGSGGDVRTVGGDNSETTAGGRDDVTLASRNGDETTTGRDVDETPTGRNSDSTTTGLSGDFTLAAGIRSATVADMRSSSVLAADRSGGVAIVRRSGGVNVSGRRVGVTVAGRSGRVIIVGRRRDAIVAAGSISSSMAIASRGDGVTIAGSSGDANTADRSGSVNSSGGSDDVATAGRSGDVNTDVRSGSVSSSGRSDDVTIAERSGDVIMADRNGSVTMDGRIGGMATIKSEIDSDGQTFSFDTHESLFPALDVDHLAADRVPSVDENNWEAPQPRVSSAQTRKHSPEYRARLAEERAPSRWQRKRARNGDGPTPWQQEVLNCIKGKEEDGFDHFGRQVASIMRRLPKKKSYVLQQAIIQLIMREDT